MKNHPSGITVAASVILAGLLTPGLFAIPFSTNPGDPLFCDPQEGVAYLIVNGGGGVFTANSDCYGGTLANDPTITVNTSQGGVMTMQGTSGNYIYTPPSPGFTGLDTFPITVTTVCNRAGGTGSAGGTTCPGSGPVSLTITLNVLPATIALNVDPNTATTIPVPPGSITGCSAVGNSGQGPVPGAVYGCVSRLIQGFNGVNPSHGTLSTSGNTLQYTPTNGYAGSDTFTVQVQGVNNDGTDALNSGNITVNVVVNAPPSATPTLSEWGMIGLGALLISYGAWRLRTRPAVS